MKASTPADDVERLHIRVFVRFIRPNGLRRFRAQCPLHGVKTDFPARCPVAESSDIGY